MKRLNISMIVLLILSCRVFGQTDQPAQENQVPAQTNQDAQKQPAPPKQVPAHTRQRAQQRAIQEITALENAWNDATRQYNVSWFERNIADSYIGTDEEGVVSDKAALIANAKNKSAKIDFLSFENFKVRVYGDAAIAAGINVVKGTYRGRDISGKYPWTDTWVKIGGRWQCVAGHSSKIASK